MRVLPGKAWQSKDIGDQSGRVFVVTGANSGLGYATSYELARHGAHVVMAVRDLAKGEAAAAKIRSAHADADLDVRRVDLADLDSVRMFAADLLDTTPQLDVLVNNAGVMMPPRTLSPQGHESQFASNHLGHFLLTGLLIDAIGGSDPRVVTLSSELHRTGRIHFEDLSGEQSYSPTTFYAQSKFANMVFGLELHRRQSAQGLPVRSLVAHPGYAATNLQTTGPTGITNLVLRIANVVVAQSAAMGALPTLYAATEPEARSGTYIGPRGLGGSRGYPGLASPVRSATDEETGRRLWELSEELTGVRYLG